MKTNNKTAFNPNNIPKINLISIQKHLKKWSPLLLTLTIFYISFTIILFIIYKKNQGHLIYILDDTYIHTSIARNFVKYGQWGININEFSSTTSSPLYTMILTALFFIFGIRNSIPLILNFLLANLLIYLIHNYFKHSKIKENKLLFTIILLFITLPLNTLVFLGMEHLAHVIVTLIYVNLITAIITKKIEDTNIKKLYSIIIVTPILTTLRYESLFLILASCIFLFYQKKVRTAIYIILSGTIPLFLYALLSYLKGWTLIPSSVLLKGYSPETSMNGLYLFFQNILTKLQRPHVLVCLLGLSIVVWNSYFSKRKRNKLLIAACLMLIVTILHISFARLSGSFRYESYFLIPSCLLIIVFLLKKKIKSKNIILTKLALTLVLIIIGLLSLKKTISIPQATTNIYEQQYQMAKFVKKYYYNDTIALNDIGAVNYLSDVNTIDLWGLADINVTHARKDNFYDTEWIYEYTKSKKVDIAIVYDHWFYQYGGLPEEWTKVGEWEIKNNIICGGNKVSFYALTKAELSNLAKHFEEYSHNELPSSVNITFY